MLHLRFSQGPELSFGGPRAMRAVRYLKTVVHYFQVFPRQRQSHMLLRAYVDASWGSERSVERRSISGGCLTA